MTNLASPFNTLNSTRLMEGTLDKLVAWANSWEMDLNVNKC